MTTLKVLTLAFAFVTVHASGDEYEEADSTAPTPGEVATGEGMLVRQWSLDKWSERNAPMTQEVFAEMRRLRQLQEFEEEQQRLASLDKQNKRNAQREAKRKAQQEAREYEREQKHLEHLHRPIYLRHNVYKM